MSYLVFARKWRPQNFEEVIGQEHIATTLKNAISLGRVAHAYLFSGPRGIGKTTTARVLAKALNCVQGPTPTPCNKCDSCQETAEGRSLDVIEIDGASNRGIEQIRQLRENVKFAPAKSRFKIYIIDEIHQITTDGFNALLKTLEEPPGHVKFIFATTQAHKVLPTILSRCQRFDFKPLSISAIVEKLKRIVETEKLDITEEALLYIARAAGGSMRDAESILDQLSSFCKERINLDTVTSVLGMIDIELLREISQKIIEQDCAGALMLVEKIINQGKELSQFIAGLMEQFRHILISKTVGSDKQYTLIDLPKEQIKDIAKQGKSLTIEEIFYIFNILVRTQENLKRSLSSRVIVEMAIVKLAQRKNLLSIENILTRLAKLERNLQKGQNFAEEKSQHFESEQVPEPIISDKPEPVCEDLHHRWQRLLESVREEKMFVASSLELGKISSFQDKVLTISFPKKCNFYKETLEQAENKKFIEQKAQEIFSSNLKVTFVLNKDTPESSNKVSYLTEQKGVSGPKYSIKTETTKKVSAEPIIQSALKIFQGRVIRRNT
jgi:DNA polymerase-3 subunit gamma/tau